MNAVFLHFILDEASKIYEVFVSIERIPQLLRYYINCQKGYLFHRWKTLIDSDRSGLSGTGSCVLRVDVGQLENSGNH